MFLESSSGLGQVFHSAEEKERELVIDRRRDGTTVLPQVRQLIASKLATIVFHRAQKMPIRTDLEQVRMPIVLQIECAGSVCLSTHSIGQLLELIQRFLIGQSTGPRREALERSQCQADLFDLSCFEKGNGESLPPPSDEKPFPFQAGQGFSERSTTQPELIGQGDLHDSSAWDEFPVEDESKNLSSRFVAE
jgi:hypothetical protein